MQVSFAHEAIGLCLFRQVHHGSFDMCMEMPPQPPLVDLYRSTRKRGLCKTVDEDEEEEENKLLIDSDDDDDDDDSDV